MIHRFLVEPYELAFMQRALLEVVLLGALAWPDCARADVTSTL